MNLHARPASRVSATVLATWLLVGCSGSSDSAASSTTTAPSPTPGGEVDAGPACPEGSHVEDGRCESALSWSRLPVAVAARDHHTTFVIDAAPNAFVYVIGGTDAWKTVHDDVLRAAIQKDGSLAPFEQVGKLPEPRAGHTAVVVGRHIVISGGHTMTGAHAMSTLDSTIVATVDDQGLVGPWRRGPDLPVPVMHHTCTALASFVYCVGGRIDGNVTSDLAVRASVSESGTVSPYEAIARPEGTIGFHQAVAHGHAIYIAGGLRRDTAASDFEYLTDVWRIPIADDGSAGAWTNAGKLPSTRAAAAAETFGERLYFVGGHDETDSALNTVLEATLAPDGRVSGTRVLPSKLGLPRMHVHQTPRHGRWIYSVGGRDRDDRSLGVVEVGAFE